METSIRPDGLKSSVRPVSPTQKEVEAELQADKVSQELKLIIDQYTTRVKLKGFRAGKAPREMVKQMFSSEIQKSLMDSLLPKIIGEALEIHGIRPVSVPVVRDLSYEEGKALRLKAVVEVWPDFTLPEYKKISVKKKEVHIEEEEIQKSLEELRQKSAEYIPVEGRGVVDGDYVIVELQGRDQKTKRLLPSEKVVVLAGHAENEKTLNENLLDLKPQEEKRFHLTYSSDHPNKKLAGRKIEYTIRVISIKEKHMPELNDEFAKHLGEYEHLDDLKNKLREELLQAKENAGKREMAEEILQKISDQILIELPGSVVEQETQALLEKLLSSYPQPGLEKEQLDNLKSQARHQAERTLKRNLILKQIAEKEVLKVSEEEIDQEIRNLAKANNLPLSQVIESINQGGKRENLRGSLLFKKTVDFLIKEAIINNQ